MTKTSNRAKRIFLHAIELTDGDERNAFVVAECADDEALMQAVDQLLQNYSNLGSFMESAAKDKQTANLSISEQPGDMIGPYKLLEQIGEGGMGVIYMVEQTEPVERRVALKIIKPGMDTQQVIARFEAERQALAAMDHPNIAKVLDGGATESGRPYFVMELVSGIPLTEFCDQQHLDVPHRLELFADVCHAVQHAHQKGIIHRDIKPSNILVTLYDGHPVPKVIDFGVAKAIRQTLTEKTIFTQLGQIVGTLEYMSPEQADPNQRDIDTRSDIYSLGVLLYELLTGETPFERQRLRSAAFDEIMRIIREEEPPRPSHRLSSSHSLPAVAASRRTEPNKLSTLVHGELDWIVMKALEKDRGRRYETANGLAADVGRYLSNEPVQAGPPSVRYRLSTFVRRNRAMIVTASLIVVLLVAGIAGTAWQAIRATREQQRTAAALATSRDNEQKAEQAAAESKAVVDFLVTDLLGSAAPEESLGRDVTVSEVLANAEQKIDTAFQDQPLVEAQVRAVIGRLYFKLGKYELAEPHFAASLDIRTRLLGDDDYKTIWTKDWLAVVWLEFGPDQKEKALELIEPTLETSRRVLGAEHKQTLSCMNTLALALDWQGEGKKARDLWEQTFEIQRRVLGAEHPQTLQTMNNLAGSLWRRGEGERARELYEQMLEVCRRVRGREHPQTLNSMHNLAIVLDDVGESEEACELAKEAYEIRSRVLGNEHRHTRMAMNTLATKYIRQGRYDEARELLEQAVNISRRVNEGGGRVELLNNLAWVLEKQGELDEARKLREELLENNRAVYGDDHPATLEQMAQLGAVLQSQGHLQEARQLLETALETQRHVLGEEHSNTLNSMNNLGNVLKRQGHLDEARELYETALEISRRVRGDEHPNTLNVMNNLGNVLTRQGRLEEARVIHETALEIRRRVFGDEHPDTVESVNNLAWVFERQGKLEEARKLFAQAIETYRRVLGEGHPDTLRSMENLSRVSGALGDLEEYYRGYEEILDIRQRHLGDEHGQTLKAMNNVAWSLLIDPDQPFADAKRAVKLASHVVELMPKAGNYRNTLGIAQYRAGNWTQAIEALEKSQELQANDGYNFPFLAMAHWQLGHPDDAQQFYDQAVTWIQSNQPENEELHRFISEAAELLQVANPFQSIEEATPETSSAPNDPNDERETEDNSLREDAENRQGSTDKKGAEGSVSQDGVETTRAWPKA